MKNFEKIINPCRVDGKNAFVKIRYKNGDLRITGVIGPTHQGDYHCSGQIIEETRAGEPTSDWTRAGLKNLSDVWRRWHMNDMNPYCEHQNELGWDEKAKEPVMVIEYVLNRDTMRQRKDIKDSSIEKLKKDVFVKLNEEGRFVLNLPYKVNHISKEIEQYYEERHREYKILGHLTPDEHPDGLLCKECPECGYRYGTEWLREEVPEDILEWLSGLPESKVEPAWI